MKKVFCPIEEPDWIVGRITQEYIETTQHKIVNGLDALTSCDTIMLFAPWCWNRIEPSLLLRKRFVIYLHHIVPEKFNENEFRVRDQFVNHYIVPNDFTYNIVKRFTNKPVTKICYWINKKLWRSYSREYAKNMIADLTIINSRFHKEISLNNNADITNSFIVGSFQRDTEGNDLISPKLEKGPDKFIDAVKQITNPRLIVLLGGWRRQYVINALKEAKISYIYFERPDINIINIMYDALDLYIVSSRHEGGPQSVGEASYKKVPIISTNCGIASEILHPDCVLDVSKKILLPEKHHIEHAYNNCIKISLEEQVKKIDELI